MIYTERRQKLNALVEIIYFKIDDPEDLEM